MKTSIGSPKTLILALTLLCVLLGSGAHAQQEVGVCARVKIELDQKVAITRTAFRATLKIGNSPVNVPLQDVSVTLDIRDSGNNPANAKFGISNPVLTSISDVSGTGTIVPGTQAVAIWTILPTRDAAPLADTKYTVGGTIAYTQSGVKVALPLFPAPITVKPDPLLQFHYFLSRDVYADDPFTPEVEPSEPFPLGLLIVNRGAGTAHNLTITSSQPKIVENEKQLQIAFQLLGASVNGLPASPSLTANLGDIAPGKTADANFLLLSSLQGKFISFSASFKHKDDLNNPRTSVIDGIDTHFLAHVVRIVSPADDGRPDFLFFSTDPLPTDLSPVPDSVWSSDGTAFPVTALLPAGAVSDGPVTNQNLTVHLVVPSASVGGFVYIRTDDPGQNVYQLTSVTRSDGKVIALGDNAWTTHRIVRLKGQAPMAENRLYLFDDGSTGAYTLTYAPVSPIKPTVAFTSPGDTDTFSPNTTLTLKASAASIQTTVTSVSFYADNALVGTSAAAPFAVPYSPTVGPHTLKAVALDANGTASDPATVGIVVNAAANKPPAVSLSGPGAASLFAPAAVTLAASASDSDGTVAKVDFYRNGQFLGSSVSAPYALALPGLTAGNYEFTATATDNQGAAVSSNSVLVQVDPAVTNTGLAILRTVSAVRMATPGQILVTVQNAGGADAVNLALVASRLKWGVQSNPTVTPAVVPMLAPNSTATFMLQFPAADASKQLKLSGTYNGRGFTSFVPVTP